MPRIATVSLLVHDLDEAITFYVGAAGFDLVEDTEQDGGRRWVVVRPPGGDVGTGLLLALPSDDDQRARVGDQAGGRVWLFLETDDFARDHARMLAAGVRFREEPRHEPYGTVAVWENLYGTPWDLIQPA
ncbi:VOC family protein [Iamia sp. SCSIO 61187]|uniref:VOC family protein n=1 Tax=Iamia sp. SCSIO 61187 TaxID=2722752 RepID=UPI002103C6AA|nr:VOC family protein [Iamia sp. SCSIO 61187]QYG91391.1 VOC family protein [Iamia sp. SCSIO 61187]